MASPNDSGYKQLFAFPELARELLCAALPLPWVRHTRPNDFEHVNASYVGHDGQ